MWKRNTNCMPKHHWLGCPVASNVRWPGRRGEELRAEQSRRAVALLSSGPLRVSVWANLLLLWDCGMQLGMAGVSTCSRWECGAVRDCHSPGRRCCLMKRAAARSILRWDRCKSQSSALLTGHKGGISIFRRLMSCSAGRRTNTSSLPRNNRLWRKELLARALGFCGTVNIRT